MPEESRKEERRNIQVVVHVTEGYVSSQTICSDLSGSGCRLRMDHFVTPKSHLRLEIYGKDDQGNLKIYEPIDGLSKWSKPSAKDPAVFFCGVEFTHKIKVEHGVLQALFPEKFSKGSDEEKP